MTARDAYPTRMITQRLAALAHRGTVAPWHWPRQCRAAAVPGPGGLQSCQSAGESNVVAAFVDFHVFISHHHPPARMRPLLARVRPAAAVPIPAAAARPADRYPKS